MKRALLVLALAVLTSAGCRAIGSKSNCAQPCGPTCGDSCGTACGSTCGNNCEPCHLQVARNAPRPIGGCEGCEGACSRGGNLEADCPGGNCGVFDRNCCQASCCGYPNAEYDCSACGSPAWGCNGYRHPQGYVDNRPSLLANGQCGPNIHCARCGRNYLGTGPAPSCCPFCGCGPSGDHNYNFNPGPPVAQTAYPYYTLRGPRDFLIGNPPSIGPY
ncbi:MAG: hypothetical protein IT425_13930 [Pirellulales bacterium]|nr:hypothetical protein [Pirellulales bacterium]